ncbi:hypothetical protein A3D03_00335 [Candidatus Gottesmanbacteria bacterium RIFCSPHIGHO2_02_FULL_40_13]|uniref:PIN domain-containing protein n=1 Tax=Candidatus Gottesmanbacteria bacterium RIFCSPHIGHO2_02_FULL_40_13 TaxID=1798384 RepID=A0A1F6A5J6_9BACT|nr:MAG: hypothetical protein A3D03_00335 [Candidatus Gottesmanbacteria bacterium RIFCSPHIGHO2_02_FULL_40_13]
MKIFIETSVFIRFLSQDDIKKYKDVSRLIEMIQEGKATPYISSMVITEIVFVLTRLYQFSKDKVLAALTDLLALRNIVLIEKTDTRKALYYFKKFNIKYSDCLIATQVPKGVALITYDHDFQKIPSLIAKTPVEMKI